MTTNRLRAAPIVTLVLSFAVVLGLGWLIGPDLSPPGPDDQSGSTPTSVPNPVPAPVPASVVPSPSPLSAAPSAVDTPEPGSTGPFPSASSTGVPVLEPDASGEVRMGPVTAGSSYGRSSLDPTVIQTRDGRLQVCVHVRPDQKITALTEQDWVQINPPRGQRFCAYVAPDTNVDFRVTS